MSKMSEFYAKAIADESAKAELIAILGEKKLEEADDAQLEKIGEVAKKLGFEISLEEAKGYLGGAETELDEEDLDAVAGGKGGSTTNNNSVSFGDCGNGIGGMRIDVDVN